MTTLAKEGVRASSPKRCPVTAFRRAGPQLNIADTELLMSPSPQVFHGHALEGQALRRGHPLQGRTGRTRCIRDIPVTRSHQIPSLPFSAIRCRPSLFTALHRPQGASRIAGHITTLRDDMPSYPRGTYQV